MVQDAKLPRQLLPGEAAPPPDDESPHEIHARDADAPPSQVDRDPAVAAGSVQDGLALAQPQSPADELGLAGPVPAPQP